MNVRQGSWGCRIKGDRGDRDAPVKIKEPSEAATPRTACYANVTCDVGTHSRKTGPGFSRESVHVYRKGG